MAKAPNPGSSTAITSVYAVRPKPACPPAEPRPARAARARSGEFKAGELVPGTRYRVLGLLGVGGMGSVYEVEHTELGKRFVLKALLSELAQRDDLVARVRNEQRALGRLEHPCIVAVTDAGTTSLDVPYFVMERLEGETLAARLKRSGPLALEDALGLAAGVLEGLAAAHHIGVIHRDVKPQNIFVAAGLRPKILDFGVAKIADVSGTITARGVAVGTPRYMSPEQASGEAVDGRSDIYALGLVLYECLVGRGPFDDVRDANEMLFAHLSRPVPRLLGRVAGLTPELDELIAGLLAKTPDARPPNAASAAAALRAARARLAPAPVQPSTVRLAPGPAAVPQPTTRLDGIAGRHGARGDGVTLDAATRSRTAASLAERTERLVLTVGPSTHGGTRTEVLPTIEPGATGAPVPLGSDVVTHTRVPVTPVESSHTLPPSRAPSRLSRVGQKRALVWLFAGAVGVCLGVLSRLDQGPRAARPAHPPRTVAGAAVSLVASSSPRGGTSTAPVRGPAVSVAVPASAAPVPPAAPGAPQKSAEVTPSGAKKARSSAKKPAKPSVALKLPTGLPSSGL